MNRKLTKIDEAELIEAYQLGYSMGAIARCLGVSRKTVRLHLSNVELRPKQSKMPEEEKKRRDAARSKRYYFANKEKCATYRKEHYEANKRKPGGPLDRSKNRYRADPKMGHIATLAKYRLSEQDWNEMFIRQSGRCDICLLPMRSPHVDHDHRTKKVRGLLCRHCNRGLGAFYDSINCLLRAADYVRKHSEVESKVA